MSIVQEKMYMDVDDVCAILGVSKAYAYNLMREYNKELKAKGYMEIYYKDMDVRLREHTMYTKRYIIDLKIRPYFEKKILSEITVAVVLARQTRV